MNKNDKNEDRLNDFIDDNISYNPPDDSSLPSDREMMNNILEKSGFENQIAKQEITEQYQRKNLLLSLITAFFPSILACQPGK